MRLPTRTQVDRNVGTEHRSCTSTAEAPKLLHVLYIFFMFCKSNVDMFLHSKLSAHKSKPPLVVHVAYDVSRRSPQSWSSPTAHLRLLPQLPRCL